MSFQPEGLNEIKLSQIVDTFRQAMKRVVGRSLSPSEGRSLLLHAFKSEGWSQPENPKRLLEDEVARRQLWRLLSAQIQSGIPIHQALTNIRKQRIKLGFPESFDEALDDWMNMMLNGKPFHEFFVIHVMPIDFGEGVRLAMGSMLSSFQDALLREAR